MSLRTCRIRRSAYPPAGAPRNRFPAAHIPHEGAPTAAERIREAVSRLDTIVAGDTVIRVTVSVGVHLCTSADELDIALSLADGALYEAKRTGRDRVVIRDGTVWTPDADPLPFPPVSPIARANRSAGG